MYKKCLVCFLGLKLVLYLETTEYLTGISTGYGARVQIHEPMSYPFPTDEGFHVSASMETSIAIKKVRTIK